MRRALFLAMILSALWGCAVPTGPGPGSDADAGPGPAGSVPVTRTVASSDERARISEGVATPLLVNGRPVTRGRLWPLLAEAAGEAVAEEAALELLLGRELERRGLALTASMLKAERERLLGSLGVEGSGPGVLERVRRRRGLGPERLEALLRRNAALRALTDGRVEVSGDEIRLAHRVTHGPRIEARVIVLATQREAAEVRRRLEGRGLDAFIRAAIDRSVDTTASVGGLLGPISPADPAYPASVRAVLSELEPGELSRVVALREGYAVFRVERAIPADGVTIEEAREGIERRLRERKQRLEMERLARDLLNDADVNVLDPSLGWAERR